MNISNINLICVFKSILVSENETSFDSYKRLWNAFLNLPPILLNDCLITVQYLKWTNVKILNKNIDTVRKFNAFPIGYDNQFYCDVLDIEKNFITKLIHLTSIKTFINYFIIFHLSILSLTVMVEQSKL